MVDVMLGRDYTKILNIYGAIKEGIFSRYLRNTVGFVVLKPEITKLDRVAELHRIIVFILIFFSINLIPICIFE